MNPIQERLNSSNQELSTSKKLQKIKINALYPLKSLTE